MSGEAKTLCCSVVIPVFDCGDLLRLVLDRLADQTVPADAFEVLVCDDGSEENLSPVIDEFTSALRNLRLLRQENQGPAAARNLGIREAKAAIVVFLDSDVIPGNSVIEELVRSLNDNSAWQGAEARLEAKGGDDSPEWDAPRSSDGGHYHTAGIAYRRDVLLQVGGFDKNFSRAACEDVELAVRVLEHGPIGFVAGALVEHPRRRRTLSSCWRSRKNWRYVMILACRYGFLSWPQNATNYPRLRTAMAATVTLPLGRLRRIVRSPPDGLRAVGLTAVDWLGGVVMLPTIIFGRVPERKSLIVDPAP